MLNKIEILGSNSKGCAYVLYFDKYQVQLDAGVKHYKVKDIDALFISHREGHRDHYLYENNYDFLPKINDNLRSRIKLNEIYFDIPHIVKNKGIVFSLEKETIAYITDCGDYSDISLDLSQATYVFIECNWDYFLIKQGIITPQIYGSYAFSKEGHMSNFDCLNALMKWKINKDAKIIFIHGSHSHTGSTSYKLFESLPNKWMVAKSHQKIFCKNWKSLEQFNDN